MRWAYKTVLYPLQKEGLLGDSFLDETEMELSLNEYGKGGWELVNLLESVEGVRAVFKQAVTELEDEDFVPASFAKPVAKQKDVVFEAAVEPQTPQEMAECKISEDEVADDVSAISIAEEEEKTVREDPPIYISTKRRADIEEGDAGSIRIE